MRILMVLLLSAGVVAAHDLEKSIDLPVPVVTQALGNTVTGAYSTSYWPDTEDDIAGWGAVVWGQANQWRTVCV